VPEEAGGGQQVEVEEQEQEEEVEEEEEAEEEEWLPERPRNGHRTSRRRRTYLGQMTMDL
jgi:hypothetical protein